MHSSNARILRLPEVLDRLGISRSTLHSKIQKGLWCPPISLGARAVGFVQHETDELIKAHIQGLTPQEIRELVTMLVAKRREVIR